MIRTGLTFNGKRITSGTQLRRELEQSITRSIENHIRKAAPLGVRLTKTSKGFEAKGSVEAINKLVKRLGK